MARLYFRIYLAVLGSLILFAMLAGLSFRFSGDGDRFGTRSELLTSVVEKLAPALDAPEDVQRRQLNEWREKSGFDIAIFNREGQVIVDASDGTLTAPRDEWQRRGPGYWRSHHWARVVQLDDGRLVVAARPRSERSSFYRFRWLFWLGLSALAVGIAAYPVVRRLTSRLEALQTGVEALGSGDLSARVPVQGKDEVARLAETFNRSADRIQTLMTANRSLLANASHELRSPLARLRMGIETLPENTGVAQKEELGRNIRELDQLIEEILLASRLDQPSNNETVFDQVDIVGLVAEECAWVDCELMIETDALPMVLGDAKLLRRLLRNLTDNAMRYGGNGVTVIVKQAHEGSVTIDICDRGPGVPDSERSRIFEPFYRAVGTRERDGGVGLGLALVRQIADRHQGTVMCLPRDGGGSVFRVMLPVQKMG
jgi:signal transduction histidine kinase